MKRTTALHRLNATAINKTIKPGALQDGAGLMLIIKSPTARKWLVRYTFAGKRRDIGLGPYPEVGLDDAREAAEKIRKQVRDGIDPLSARAVEKGKHVTFKEAFEEFFAHKKKTLSNGKHIAQWTSTMETYVYPKIGHLSVAHITAKQIIDVLTPIWHAKPETASRVLQRIRAVFDVCIVLGYRSTASPCTGVTHILGKLEKDVHHHASIPYTQAPAFVQRLRNSGADPITKLAFEFLILNASRSGEVRLAPAAEVNPRTGLWTIPAERMKSNREHVVPLCSQSLEIYRQARKITGNTVLLFPSRDGESPLSDMVFTKLMRDWGIGDVVTAHGFRSTFKTWCAEADKVRDEVSEVALAHIDPDKVRAAYKRAAYLDERKLLMERWAIFLTAAKITPKTTEDQLIAA